MAKRKTKRTGKVTVCFPTRHGRVCFKARPKRRSR